MSRFLHQWYLEYSPVNLSKSSPLGIPKRFKVTTLIPFIGITLSIHLTLPTWTWSRTLAVGVTVYHTLPPFSLITCKAHAHDWLLAHYSLVLPWLVVHDESRHRSVGILQLISLSSPSGCRQRIVTPFIPIRKVKCN